MMTVFLSGRLLSGIDADKTWIETLQSPFDRSPLPGCVGTLQHDNDRAFALFKAKLEIEKTELAPLQFAAVFFP